ncbi:major facilitator superfamily transporter [Diplodia corticola]|uniref:Major facilitator superfamily transporter n=1 Tax=Diplodia corticola TaxID=236234 RepID=A0A1J9RK20_9PEZI|nr:major facilitator superfamily transporter [Diplodia corticola]OJD40825.1 major facilitator superfamily transporter [Diplodia corticola]
MNTDPEKHASQTVLEDPVPTPSSKKEQYAGDEREGPWIRFMTWIHWYSKAMPSLEKRLVLKLDLMILIFGCLSFFTKYLDQQSITNAYVSGMKEDLHLHGNQLNYITIVFWASYCTSMIPACYYLTRHPVNIVLPVLEIGWGFATFGLAWAQNVETVYAMRFLVGLFESCSFTGVIYVIGSWYKPREVGRRVALFFIASPLGTMFAGYLQAAAYTNLNGAHGLSGWRWLFIVDAIITLPISLLGFFIFPDVPSRAKPRLLTPQEHTFSQRRLAKLTAPPQLHVSRDIFARVFGRWHWYLFVLQWTLMDQNFQPYSTPFSLYLKAKSPAIYSVSRVNTLPTLATALSVVAALCAGAAADRLGGRFWIPMVAVTLPVLASVALLVAWDVGETGRVAAFVVCGFEGAVSPLTMGWATVAMAGDAEERAVVTASMNAVGQAVAAWSQLLQFPAVDAPRFAAGFVSVLVTVVCQLLLVPVIAFLCARDKRRKGGE